MPTRANDHHLSAGVLLHGLVHRCQRTDEVILLFDVVVCCNLSSKPIVQRREFAKTIKRPFGVRYNPYTQSVEILSNTRKIMDLVSELKGDLCIVTNALAKIKEDNDNNNLDGAGGGGSGGGCTDCKPRDDHPDQPVVALRDGGTGNFEALVVQRESGGQGNHQKPRTPSQQTLDIEEMISAVKGIQSLNQSDA